MNTRIIVATVAGGAALFLLGFVVYGLVLESWMESQMVKHDGLIPRLTLSRLSSQTLLGHYS